MNPNEYLVENEDHVENIFLSMMFFESKKVFNLLQIKAEYLKDYIKQKIFNLMLDSYEKLGVVDTSFILSKITRQEFDAMSEIVNEDYTPVGQVSAHFMSAQSVVLSNYKKRQITKLTNRLNNNELSCDDYLKETLKLDNMRIITEGNYITMDELVKGLYSGVRINFNNFPKLNKVLALKETDFLVVAGKTGTGKSGLMVNFLNDLMENYHCIYLNLEVSKNTIYSRLMSVATGKVPMDSILEKKLTDNQKLLVNGAAQKIVKSKVIIETKSYSIEEIETYIRIMKEESQKHTIVFIDHIGLIESSDSKKSKSIYEQATENAKLLRQICMKYNVTIIAACQLKRSDSRDSKITLNDLKDSGEIENSACQVILMNYKEKNSNDSTEPKMILDVAKNRANFTGQVDVISTRINQVFKEISDYDYK